MRKLLPNRRGSVAFATVIALVPVLGLVALGAEATTWYVTKQQAQTAADAAAYSGALKLACDLTLVCPDTGSTVDSRGEQFAAQNLFCNSGATYTGCASLPAGITQTVVIDEPAANQVRATVTQLQPAFFAAILGAGTVTISATATAKVDVLSKPCVLSLVDPIVIQGATTVNAESCGLTSNNRESDSIEFVGSGSNLTKAGTFTGAGGCDSNGNKNPDPCEGAVTYASVVKDPLSNLYAAVDLLSASSFAKSCTPTTTTTLINLDPYSATNQCYYKMGNNTKKGEFNFESGKNYLLKPGVYFFSGDLNIGGNTTVGMDCDRSLASCGVTLILLHTNPQSTLTISGTATIDLKALETVAPSQVPPALSAPATLALMSDLLIYDPETTTGNKQVNISGSTGSHFDGIIYAPNASVKYTGNTDTSTGAAYSCSQIIAKGVELSGSSMFDNSGCESTSTTELRTVKMLY